jgi:cytochrome c oxidase cbb3-type subunit 3
VTAAHAVRLAALVAAAVASAGCARGEDDPARPAAPSSGERALVVASDFRAGATAPAPPEARNPFEGDARALADGERLYGWMNCAGCHGALGGGGIGPPLRDVAWIYGGDAASVFQSVAQGRPNGMPAFGGRVPDAEIWRIVAYVRSLGGAPPEEARQGSGSGDSPTQPGTSGG